MIGLLANETEFPAISILARTSALSAGYRICEITFLSPPGSSTKSESMWNSSSSAIRHVGYDPPRHSIRHQRWLWEALAPTAHKRTAPPPRRSRNSRRTNEIRKKTPSMRTASPMRNPRILPEPINTSRRPTCRSCGKVLAQELDQADITKYQRGRGKP